MIEFNLLPDVKVQYVKAEKLKVLVVTVSTIVSIVSLIILSLLIIYVYVVQSKVISNLNNDIQNQTSQINQNTNLNKILTIQKQSITIPLIQKQLYQPSRIYSYMAQLTPSAASITSIDVDFTKNSISVTGKANSPQIVNQFVDTLKFTDYKVNNTNKGRAFNTVTLSSFSYTTGSLPTYTITFNYANDIFMANENTSLVIPNITSTRSVIDQPNDLFQKAN